MSLLPIGISVRLGVVSSVGRTYIDFQFLDSVSESLYRTPIPHPYAGRGGGIFVGIEVGAIIMVASGPGEKWYCIGTIPDHNFYFDLDGAIDITVDETSYPPISNGEVILKSNAGSRIELLKSGNIRVDGGLGLSLADWEISRLMDGSIQRTPSKYAFSEAGRSIEGVIKRDMNSFERKNDTKSINFLDGEEYETFLSDIGRSNLEEVQNRTTRLMKQTVRNPALIEKRQVIYEYADSFDVRFFENELRKATANTDELIDLNTPEYVRSKRRTDLLNLNERNFNHLIEKVEGTLVDIYGNVLDLNRGTINIPSAKTLHSSNVKASEVLKRIYDYHRRGVKFHYEINSRKDTTEEANRKSDSKKNNAKKFSRWSVDVDSEGLTKVNIPASSETGNIPVLGRYFTNRDEEDDRKDLLVTPKDAQDRRDLLIKQIGPGGVKIDNEDYLPKTLDGGTVTAGTAYHDILKIASSIFSKNGSLTNPSKVPGVSSSGPVENTVNNKISSSGGPDTGANAGGRSLNINLDGSLEMSVGADTVDRKSMVLDTQGAVLSRFGRDKNGRSIIHQSDGDVLIQIGGDGVGVKDDRFSKPDSSQPGRLEIHLSRGGGTPQKILIDENGLTLDVQGNMMFKSSGDMALDAGGRLLLHGELIYTYGSTDVDKRQIVGSQTLIVRSGSPQFT